ncbi:MAG: hypothetical protein AB1505_10845 [Candidatus Latescibacterota bacterium]
MLEADFAITCSQCGGQEFYEIYPVPAAVYRVYGPAAERGQPHEVVAAVYACLQCGHLEEFVDLGGRPHTGQRATTEGGPPA